MKSENTKTNIAPCWIDHVCMTLGRPWVFAIAFGFLLIPSHLLVAAINTGAAFLKIDTGARPTGMGGAYTAMADDVDALYYNPGGLANLKQRELGATHAKWLMDSTFDFVGYAHPLSNGALGFGVTRLGVGGQKGRDANRQTIGGFAASDTAYTVGYSRMILKQTSFGGSVKYLQSRIGQYSASAMAFDLGAQHQMKGMPLSLGVSVLNIGKGMSFLDQNDPLPISIGVGAAYRLSGALNMAFDIRREVYDRTTDIRMGTEYALMPSLSLRAGYTSTFAQQMGSTAGGLGAFGGGLGGGFGLKYHGYRFDYTFTPLGPLGNAQRLSLGAKF